jgi:hypothetical protein
MPWWRTARRLGQTVAIGDDRAAFARRDQLRGMEGERRHVGQRSDPSIADRAAERVRRVGDDDPAVLVRER